MNHRVNESWFAAMLLQMDIDIAPLKSSAKQEQHKGGESGLFFLILQNVYRN